MRAPGARLLYPATFLAIAALCVAAVGLAERVTLYRMGGRA